MTKFNKTLLIISAVIIALLGSFLLYLKLRPYKHTINDEIEDYSTTNNNTETDMQKPDSHYNLKRRGYRNNNPLNIRINNYNNWKGEIKPSTDGSFCQFQTMAYGFRAAMVTIRTYIRKHNCKTIQEIINRWAPWSDGNNPTNYAKRVIARFPDDFPNVNVEIDPTNMSQMTKLVFGMAIVENIDEPVMADCIEAFKLM